MKLKVCHGIEYLIFIEKHFLKILSQNRDYLQTHCNDRNNPFHFACQTWIKNCK